MKAIYYLYILVSTIVSCSSQCTDSAGCFPPTGDITLNRSITVTSSCSDGDQYTLIDNTTLVCDSIMNSPLSINDDNTATYWVSGIDSNLQLPLTVQLDIESSVYFYSTNITWSSRTPSALRLERNNGSDWLPYRYYSDNCMTYYNLIDSAPNEVFPDQEPICTPFIAEGPGAKVSLEF